MLRLYVDLPLSPHQRLDLPPGAARHAQVRRVQPGDGLVLFNGSGGEWIAEVVAMSRQGVEVRVTEHRAATRELSRAITLAVGMPANERMDWLIEKATELGASQLQPLMCERAVLRLDGERAARKREHWQAQAVAAAEQSGGTTVPRVLPVRRLGDWLAEAGMPAARWVLCPAAHPGLPILGSEEPVVVLSGPEGGLTPAEETQALQHGFVAVGLGPRVLRADTAPLAVLAALALQAAGPRVG
jgi:16S rRNA (uracil1498-N3)-methyltransferase